jgi:hypothetical protein
MLQRREKSCSEEKKVGKAQREDEDEDHGTAGETGGSAASLHNETRYDLGELRSPGWPCDQEEQKSSHNCLLFGGGGETTASRSARYYNSTIARLAHS